METKELVALWFKKWDEGDFLNIPVADNFKHTSPYGTIDGKRPYLDLVAANQDKFLGNRIVLHDQLYEQNRACVRYTVSKGNFSMEVSEWFYLGTDQIEEIVAYYNIEGEISEERKLTNLNE